VTAFLSPATAMNELRIAGVGTVAAVYCLVTRVDSVVAPATALIDGSSSLVATADWLVATADWLVAAVTSQSKNATAPMAAATSDKENVTSLSTAVVTQESRFWPARPRAYSPRESALRHDPRPVHMQVAPVSDSSTTLSRSAAFAPGIRARRAIATAVTPSAPTHIRQRVGRSSANASTARAAAGSPARLS
jgi:hypothetical protein